MIEQSEKKSSKIIDFLKGSYDEVLTKVSWPTWQELQASSTLVLVASLIFALVIGVVDFGFKNVMESIYQSFK